MNTRAQFANLTSAALLVYGLLTILTLIVRVLTTSTALVLEIGERFVEAGDAACAAARASGTQSARSGPTVFGTTTRAYNATRSAP
ncbi:hypothetical protein [Kutzneria chonburiensis]|uniref:Secreted protein n=1 Tax=Kutzneria chonburiensis TaxID=1483604 RepID=A0ABV6N254_9PSEU|nr:hypothetical protein [Kutzneria chonburiensis]